MLSPLVSAHVFLKAKRMGVPLPVDWKNIIHRELDEYRKSKIKILYLWLWDGGGKVPNALSVIPGIILLNAEWAAAIVLFQKDEKMHDALKLTIGHEMTHQEGDYFFIEPFSKAAKFVCWVGEVHADFGGAIKAFDGDSKRCIEAMQFKKDRKGKRDKDTHSHPSWQRRIDFVKEADFSKDLIYKIACITGCTDIELIERVCEYYKEIKLETNHEGYGLKNSKIQSNNKTWEENS